MYHVLNSSTKVPLEINVHISYSLPWLIAKFLVNILKCVDSICEHLWLHWMISVRMRKFKVWLPLFSKIFSELTRIFEKNEDVWFAVWSYENEELLMKEDQFNEKVYLSHCKHHQWEMRPLSQAIKNFSESINLIPWPSSNWSMTLILVRVSVVILLNKTLTKNSKIKFNAYTFLKTGVVTL